MTEKRFKFRDTIDNEVFLKKRICDDYTNKSYDSTLKDQEDLCEILNELNDENTELQKQVILFKTRRKDVEDIIIKNSVLHKENTNLQVELLSQLEEIEILSEENKDLKKELDYYKNQCIDENVKWLRENTVWEQMPTTIRTVSKTHLSRSD